MTDEYFTAAIALHLGLPVYGEHVCKCGSTVNVKGYHAFSCKRNNGKIAKHNVVNVIIGKALASINMPNKLEPTETNSNNLRPDGITYSPWCRGKQLAWDFTCPHPLMSNNRSTDLGTKTADHAESAKLRKYSSLCTNMIFSPVAITTFGAYGAHASKLLREVGLKMRRATGNCRAFAELRQQIAVAIQNGNGRQLLYSLNYA